MYIHDVSITMHRDLDDTEGANEVDFLLSFVTDAVDFEDEKGKDRRCRRCVSSSSFFSSSAVASFEESFDDETATISTSSVDMVE